ncbi:MAG: hypothetical protein ACOVSR_09970 [Bacteroidia bacterium]
MKKPILLFTLLFLLRIGFCQASKEIPTITIIALNQFENNCDKAFKIIDDSIFIDTCYNKATKLLNSVKTTSIKNNPIYSKLYSVSDLQWKNAEVKLNTIKTCDYAIEYKIILFNNNLTKTYFLKGFKNCYPNDCKELLNNLDSIFNQLSN